MAEKHKSKYKKPENKKPTYRKDLKDYTMDDKDGKMNPKTTGDKQLNVLRKTDKPVQDDGKMFPKYEADDRLYKDLEDGEWDPKTAAKRLKKHQDTEEKDTQDVLKDKIENLTREQRERLVREYVRRKIVKTLYEQATTEEPTAEDPNAEPTADTTAPTDTVPDIAAEDPMATPEPAPTPAPAMPAPAPESMPTPPPAEPTAEPDDSQNTEIEPTDPAEKTTLAVEKFSNFLKSESGNVGRIKAISRAINSVFKDAESEDAKNFYNMLRVLSLKKLASLSTTSAEEK